MPKLNTKCSPTEASPSSPQSKQSSAQANLSISLKGIRTFTQSPLLKLIGDLVPKKMWLTTYTLGYDAVMELNQLHKKGCKITVIYAKLVQCVHSDLLFKGVLNTHNHTKIWAIDNDIYVGSANLVGDTIANLMVKVKDKETKDKTLILLTYLVDIRKPTKSVTRFFY